MFVPVLRWCVGMCAVMKGRRLFSSVFEITMSLLGFGMGTILANIHMCGVMFLLREVLNMLVRNASPMGPMCFMSLMFSL